MNNKVEILAPAGNFDCLVAALKSGADAIYVGGDKFGARANANNFSVEELKEAIDLVHLHGKQLYLTVNTLLKEDELQSELYDYIYPLYIHGIDAVIVQDLGVLNYIKEYFTELPIHASTQMTVTNLLGAKLLEQLGVERVVTSRELSLEEVKEISECTSLEIESFVHGALCYSFSGQCLFSSMIGGRSGNRGQCAQPCRLTYQYDHKTDYLMSLKDICTLYEIPALIDAGVFSFKIEGRMKKPEYVASVTSMYRKYVDLYLEKGIKGYKVLEEDVDMLRDIFNRGDFHNGYWKQHNGIDMITREKPSHTGLPVLKVQEQNGRIYKGIVLKELHKGDILEISNKGDNYTLGQDYKKGESVDLSLRKGVSIPKGTLIYRTRNQWLIESIHLKLTQNKLQESVSASLVLTVGHPAILNLQYGNIYTSTFGEIVEEAERIATSKDKIIKQMNKTGNSSFYFKELDVISDDNIFIPIQQINQLRREGLQQLEEEIKREHRRSLPLEKIDSEIPMGSKKSEDNRFWEMAVYVESLEQFEVICTESIFDKIYLDCNAINSIWDNSQIDNAIKKAREYKKAIYLVMPHIFRKETIQIYEIFYNKLKELTLDGIMVRNLEEFQFLRSHGYEGEVLLDHHVYAYNNKAIEFWDKQGVKGMTNSLELTANELRDLNQDEMELLIYGYIPTMVSAQCIKKTRGKCTHSTDIIKIKDRINKEINVKSCCDYCYNIVYNTCPISLLDEYDEIRRISPRSLRVAFTIESANEVRKVVASIYDFVEKQGDTLRDKETTKGHFRRGVK